MEPIQVEFTFTADIFIKTQRYILWQYYTKGWMKWIFIGLALIWTVKLLIEATVLIALGSIALFAGLWWLLFNWLSKRNFNKFPAMKHPIHYEFSEAEVTLNTHNAQSVLQWAAFRSAVELSEFFLLYQNHLVANPILKSGFRSESDLERFRVLLGVKGLLK